MSVYYGCAKKIERAVKHLNGLDESAKRFGKEHGEPGIFCAIEPNSQGTRALATVEKVPEYPEVEWGLSIGDAVHCLRSSLDQLVAGLCTETSRRTGFPICKTKREWVVDAPAQIWSLPEPFLALIDNAQPYHRGDQAHMHPLAVLNELWNLDKHRAIPATALVASAIKIEVDWERTVGIKSATKFKRHPGLPLKKGTVIADCGYEIDPTATEAKMYVNAHVSAVVGFGTVEGASSISHKPVRKTFENSLIPETLNIVKIAMAIHDGLR